MTYFFELLRGGLGFLLQTLLAQPDNLFLVRSASMLTGIAGHSDVGHLCNEIWQNYWLLQLETRKAAS